MLFVKHPLFQLNTF